MCALPVPFGPPLGYLMDRISTRDAWLHRVDLCRATARPLRLTADHVGRLVADVVAGWAKLHGRPFDLTLAGPAGGRWREGRGGEVLELDAIGFCQILSGRANGDGLLTTRDEFRPHVGRRAARTLHRCTRCSRSQLPAGRPMSASWLMISTAAPPARP